MLKLKIQKPKLLSLGLVAVFAAIGATFIFASHASSPTAAFEAESGTVTSPASAVGDTTASANSAVKFQTASGGSNNCAPFPAFPDTTCTGVPAGYSLTTVSSFSSSSNGQTIDGKLVTGDLTINNDNVTVTNTRVQGYIFANGHKGLTLRHVDAGPSTCPASSDGSVFAVNGVDGFSMYNSHLHNTPDDIVRVGGGNPFYFQDSIIDQTCFYPGDHLDTVQWYDPSGLGSVTLVHNVIDVRAVNTSNLGNSAVFWADGAASGTTLTMYNNKFGGGQITTALYDAVKGSGIVIDVHDNVYIKNSYAGAPCSFGSSVKSIVFDGTSGVKFNNNKLDDGTAVSCS